LVGARSRSTSITESRASLTCDPTQPGAVGRAPACLSGRFAVENQSWIECGSPSSARETTLAGECIELTRLSEDGLPPFGPGRVCVSSAAMPVESTTSREPSIVAGLICPKEGRMDTARASPSGLPSARSTAASSRPHVRFAGVAGNSSVVWQMPRARAS
jgi:hypothetical protein